MVWLCGRLAEWRNEDGGVAGWWCGWMVVWMDGGVDGVAVWMVVCWFTVETGLWFSGLVAGLAFSFVAWCCS